MDEPGKMKATLQVGTMNKIVDEDAIDLEFYDFVYRPNYTREIKIKVKAIHVDRSLPKIFAD